MKLVKVLGASGISIFFQGVSAQADDLSAIRAEIEGLTARIVQLEARPSWTTDDHVMSLSGGLLRSTRGVPLSQHQLRPGADRAPFVSFLPAADAAPGAAISWSGYIYAGAVYTAIRRDGTLKTYGNTTGQWVLDDTQTLDGTQNNGDVGAHSELLVQASNHTSVGTVGAKLKLWGDYNGNDPTDLYAQSAWGYWSMTPELTVSGGYNASLGYLDYGYDGSCTCYFTDNADVSFDPGDTTQLRLTYARGGYSMAVALEDSSLDDNDISSGMLGAAAQLSYTGDVLAGQIAGVWRDSNEQTTGASAIWQVGAGGSVTLGEVASLTFAAAAGQGPYLVVTKEGAVVNGLAYDNTWWGVNALASVNFNEASHIEVAAGYKSRDGNQKQYNGYFVHDASYDVFAVMGGLYYAPIDQLTLGAEGEWSSESTTVDASQGSKRYVADDHTDTLTADVVAFWSF